MGRLVNLEILQLTENNLTGPIPDGFGKFRNLRWLYLYDNNLTGSIPPELGTLPKLECLFLNGNSLTGTIPAELGNLPNLQMLHLSGNNLTGCIPGKLRKLPDYENDFAESGLPFCGDTTRPAPPSSGSGPVIQAGKPRTTIPRIPSAPTQSPNDGVDDGVAGMGLTPVLKPGLIPALQGNGILNKPARKTGIRNIFRAKPGHRTTPQILLPELNAWVRKFAAPRRDTQPD